MRKRGAIFKITTKGIFAVLHAEGSYPIILDSPLLAHTNGLLYGTNFQDAADNGTLYSLDVGLKPFVSVQTNVGKVGTSVNILGQGFTGATNVSFNGKSAAFTVVSDTFMTAAIPTGATSGYVTVTGPAGTLKSSQKFKVKP